jgi:hypothetical protein
MATKVDIGDVVEIPTKLGNAYAQFSNYHSEPPKFGALLRVLPGLFRERPIDFARLIAGKEVFSTFFPLQAAVNRGIVRIVGREPVPPHARKFPLFRAGNINPNTGKVEQWWLWDGTKSWKIDKLSDEQLDLPIEGVWNDTMLIQRIEQGWTPRNADYFVALARAKKKEPDSEIISQIRHYLRLKNRDDANVAVQRVGELEVRSEIHEHNGECMVVVYQNEIVPEERERVRAYLSDVAAALGGEYDGWEFKIGG